VGVPPLDAVARQEVDQLAVLEERDRRAARRDVRDVAAGARRRLEVLAGEDRSFWSARRTPGRAMPAAQPQTELTTSIAVPDFSAMKASTSAAVRSSCTPALVSSSRIGLTISSL
jgi:hypothetical protein